MLKLLELVCCVAVALSCAVTVRPKLSGKVALVTGATRGIGRGIALGLAEAGATVYVTGRSSGDRVTEAALGGTLESTVEEIHARGGVGHALVCDHSDDGQVAEAFRRIEEKEGRLDLLVNNAFQTPVPPNRQADPDLLFRNFWEQPPWFWDALHSVGLRSHYVASFHAFPLLRKSKSEGGTPLVVHISSFGGVSYSFNVAYGVAKGALLVPKLLVSS